MVYILKTQKVNRCHDCKRFLPKVSRRNLCLECQLKRLAYNVDEIRNKRGAGYEKWKAGMERFIKSIDEPKKSETVNEIVERLRGEYAAKRSKTS